MIVGVGPATGTTLCRRLAGKYRLIMVARSEQRIRALETDIANAHAYVCDISDSKAWGTTLTEIRSTFGTPRRILLNTESAAWGEYSDITLDKFAASFAVNAVGFLQMIQVLFPDKHDIEEDSRIIISSSPAAYNPPTNFLGLAPSRVAQRVMAELMNDALSKHGLRFSVFSIDGAIDEPKMRAAFPDQPTSYFIQPADIAAKMETLLESKDFPIRSGISGASSFA